MKQVLTMRSGGHQMSVAQALAYGKLVVALESKEPICVEVSCLTTPNDIKAYDIVIAIPAHAHYSDNPRSTVWKTAHHAEAEGIDTYIIFPDGSILGPHNKAIVP